MITQIYIKNGLKCSIRSECFIKNTLLKGKIEKSLGGDKYQFNDGTGIIIIEIDDDEWDGIFVTPNNIIEITGEIDKNMMSAPTVDVESITVIE